MSKRLLRVAVFLMAALAQSALAQVGGQVAYLSGTITAKKADGSSLLLTVKSAFDEGDVLSTAQDSYARLKFVDGSEIALRPSTTLEIRSVRYDEKEPAADSFAVGLIKGGLRVVTGLIGKRSKEKVQYGTAVATIGIRGTHFGAMLCQQDDCKGLKTLGGRPLKDGLYADQAAGSTEVANEAGALILEAGHFAFVADASTRPEEVAGDDAFRVVLPFSVLFDESTQVWSDGVVCTGCVMH